MSEMDKGFLAPKEFSGLSEDYPGFIQEVLLKAALAKCSLPFTISEKLHIPNPDDPEELERHQDWYDDDSSYYRQESQNKAFGLLAGAIKKNANSFLLRPELKVGAVMCATKLIEAMHATYLPKIADMVTTVEDEFRKLCESPLKTTWKSRHEEVEALRQKLESVGGRYDDYQTGQWIMKSLIRSGEKWQLVARNAKSISELLPNCNIGYSNPQGDMSRPLKDILRLSEDGEKQYFGLLESEGAKLEGAKSETAVANLADSHPWCNHCRRYTNHTTEAHKFR